MPLGYVLAIIFGCVWLGFKLLEVLRNKRAKEAMNNVVDTVKSSDTDINDLML